MRKLQLTSILQKNNRGSHFMEEGASKFVLRVLLRIKGICPKHIPSRSSSTLQTLQYNRLFSQFLKFNFGLFCWVFLLNEEMN